MARREITGRKPGATPPDQDDNEPPRLALSIQQFCQAHSISEDFFYKLKRQGEAPRLMKVGTRTLISLEAAAEWRLQHEQQSATAAKTAHKAAHAAEAS